MTTTLCDRGQCQKRASKVVCGRRIHRRSQCTCTPRVEKKIWGPNLQRKVVSAPPRQRMHPPPPRQRKSPIFGGNWGDLYSDD